MLIEYLRATAAGIGHPQPLVDQPLGEGYLVADNVPYRASVLPAPNSGVEVRLGDLRNEAFGFVPNCGAAALARAAPPRSSGVSTPFSRMETKHEAEVDFQLESIPVEKTTRYGSVIY